MLADSRSRLSKFTVPISCRPFLLLSTNYLLRYLISCPVCQFSFSALLSTFARGSDADEFVLREHQIIEQFRRRFKLHAALCLVRSPLTISFHIIGGADAWVRLSPCLQIQALIVRKSESYEIELATK